MSISGDLPLNLVSPISKLHDGLSTNNVKTFESATPSRSINLNQIFLDSLCDTDSSDEESQMSLKRQTAINSMSDNFRQQLQTSTDYQASEQAFDYSRSSNLPDVVNSSLFSLKDTSRANQALSTMCPAYSGQPEHPRATYCRNSCSVQPHCGNVYVNQIQQSAFFSSSLHKSAFQVDYGPIGEQFGASRGLVFAQNAGSHVSAFPQLSQVPPPNELAVPSPDSVPQRPADIPSVHGNISTSVCQTDDSLGSPQLVGGCLPHYHSLTSSVRPPFSSVENDSVVAHCGAIGSDTCPLRSAGSTVQFASHCQDQPPQQVDDHFFSPFSRANGAMHSDLSPPPKNGYVNTGTKSLARTGIHRNDGFLDGGFDDDVSLAIFFKRRKRGSNSKRPFQSERAVHTSRRCTSTITSNVNSERRIFHYSSGRMISHESHPVPTGDSVSAIRCQMSLMKSAYSLDGSQQEILQTLASVANRSLEVYNTMDLSTGYHEKAVSAKPDANVSVESPFRAIIHNRPILSAGQSRGTGRNCVASANNAGYDVRFASDDSPTMVEGIDDATVVVPDPLENIFLPGSRAGSTNNSASLIPQSVSPTLTLSNDALNTAHAFGQYAGLYSQCWDSLTVSGDGINTKNLLNQGQWSCAWDAANPETHTGSINSTENHPASMLDVNDSSDDSVLDESVSEECLVSENSPSVENPVSTVLRSRERIPLDITHDTYFDNGFGLGESDGFVIDEERLGHEKGTVIPGQDTSQSLPTDNEHFIIVTPTIIDEFGMHNPNNISNIPSSDRQKESFQSFMDVSSIDDIGPSPRNLINVPSYDQSKQTSQNLWPLLATNMCPRNSVMDIPSNLVHRAFDEGRYWDVFRIIRENVFPDEQKPFLRRLWSKALVCSFNRVTSLRVSDWQKTIIGQQHPVPESIGEKLESPFEVITVE